MRDPGFQKKASLAKPNNRESKFSILKIVRIQIKGEAQMKNLNRLSILSLTTLLILPLAGNSSAFSSQASMKQKISKANKKAAGTVRNHYQWRKPVHKAPDNAGVVVRKPDLIVAGVSNNICLGGGSVTIKNIGNKTSKPSHTQFNASSTTYKSIPSLQPNQSVTITGITHPSPKFNDLSMWILADYPKQNNESNETNNKRKVHCIY